MKKTVKWLLAIAVIAGVFMWVSSQAGTSKIQQKIQMAVEQASQQNAQANDLTEEELEDKYCAQEEEEIACRDCVYLWSMYPGDTVKNNIPAYVNGAKGHFAQTLRKDKRLIIGIRDGTIALVEKRQYLRLLGENNDIPALKEFLEAGEFTFPGWNSAFRYLAQLAKEGKLDAAQIKELKKWDKSACKRMHDGTLPVVRTDRNPFGPGNLGVCSVEWLMDK